MNQAISGANKVSRLLPVLALLGTPVAAQFQQQARMVLATPLKVAVKPPPQGARAGDPMPVAVQFQDGRDQPAALHEESGVELQLLGPKGEIVQKTSCKIRAGTPEATCKVTAPKPGLYKVRALPANHELLEGTGYVLVRPDAAPERRTPQRELPLKNKAWWSRPSFLIPVGYQPEPPPPAAPTTATCGATRSAAKVLLLINDGGETGGAFRAGLDTAKIQAFFAADDGGAAPVDIKIWLTPDHGTIDHQPLVLSKCGVSAEAHLSSNFVGQATVHYAVAPATFKVEATPTLQASFVRPIIGIGIVPNGPQTLSLIDTVPVVAQFFDIDGNVVPTDSERTVTFVSNNSIISPKQQRITLKAGEASAQTMILLSGSGRARCSSRRTGSRQLRTICRWWGKWCSWCACWEALRAGWSYSSCPAGRGIAAYSSA
jgi:hypothetical protein